MKHTIERLRSEYLEMPGLRLTSAQVQRLCGVDPTMCQPILDALVDVRFLHRNADGTYVRVADAGPFRPRPAYADLLTEIRRRA